MFLGKLLKLIKHLTQTCIFLNNCPDAACLKRENNYLCISNRDIRYISSLFKSRKTKGWSDGNFIGAADKWVISD